jgi:acyl transferase domain-containing protein
VRHLRGQVRFAANLALLLAEPDRVLVEAGPGQTLTRLAQANGAEPARALATQPQPASLDGCSSLLLALSGLWLRGWEPDWAALTNGLPRARVPLPTYPFQRRRLWIDPVAPAPARAERETGGLDDAPPAQASAPADQPQTLAQALTAVWQEVFGLPGLGPADDFLTLGGDSLLAVRLVARIKERLGRPVAVAAIFECRTAEALARALASGLAATPPAPAREEGVL